MPVSFEKEKELLERMQRLGVSEDDLQETFIRSSGPGGQKVNKTSTCVYLVHSPSGLSVKCQKTRSQAMNRFLARRILLERIERLQKGQADAERKRIEKLKRQKRKRSKRAQEKVLQAKRRQSEKKASRSKVSPSAPE
ncbi:MAG TPA: peptide chain release factor-like protein [Syntrophales bacterium]|nr:peptide chain release factor-like protein [Syntrophales bacterium]HOX95436.1 peptide chain release factor-like protein [Syntrophales bacterium]HPI58344.1 peptide chain release factor-like protein [Syntrophales bacterium]HPN26201.1 peptide chain release factor-like protein [Syntrophales bacterium]HQM30594.1 peptide chain release factor-like protein [Syntrophales bacterium]